MTILSKRITWPKSQIVNSAGEIIDFLSITSGDNTSSGIFILDPEGNVIDFSTISAESTGGGGSDVYDNIEDFTATATIGTKDVILSGGPPFVLQPINVLAGRLIRYTSTGEKVSESFTGLTISGSTITFQGIDNFATGDTVLLEIKGPDKSRDVNQDVGKYNRENTEADSYAALEKTSYSAINDRIYKTIKFDDNFRKVDIAYALTDATGYDLKVFATWDYAATDPTDGADPSVAWRDVTTNVFGGAVTGVGTDTDYGTFVGMPYKVLLQTSLQNAAGTAALEWRKYNF